VAEAAQQEGEAFWRRILPLEGQQVLAVEVQVGQAVIRPAGLLEMRDL